MTGAAPGPGRRAAQECLDEVCVTCSDTAVTGTVVSLLDGGLAIVDTGDGREEVGVALVDASQGDAILVHAGEAIAVLRGDRDDAAE
jgi:hydrogenase expression/formation protein HypC